MAKILIVEDDPDLSTSLKQWFEQQHHACDVVGNGNEAVEMFLYTEYDLLILDVQLPGLSGIEVLRRFRAARGSAPVIMLTSRSETRNKLEGLDSGADDYVTKPFDPEELSARVRAQLRRQQTVFQETLIAGDLEMDTASHVVRNGNVQIHLMPKEFSLLEFLMRHPNQAFSADALLDRIWPSSAEVSPALIKAYVAKLRQKIDTEGQPSLITTVHGVGYKLTVTPGPGSEQAQK